MAKYIVVLVALIIAGGLFLYSTQTAEAPTGDETPSGMDNPFGEPADVVGTLDDSEDSEDSEMEFGEEDDSPATVGGGTGGVSSGPGTAVVTRAQLAAHSMQSDCWIGYQGVVYDITSWLPRHPGSAAAIAPYCGTADEFAAAFNKQHGTSKDARLKQEGTVEGTLGN